MAGPADRTLRLLGLLQQRSRWSGPELADRLGVDVRTLRRDVDRLRSQGYRVEAAPGPTGGYRLGTGTAVPPLLLDDDEATAIALALGAAAAGTVTGLEEPALSALAKLDRVLPAHLRHRVGAVREATVALAGADAVDPEVLVALARAAAGHERLRLGYTDREGRASERRVDPWRLVPTGRRWYLVAFDQDRQAWRTLRVDRITAVTATGHRFELDDPPDAAELVSRASGVAPYRITARVVVTTSPEELRRRVPPTVALVEPHPAGALLTVGADDVAFLAGHLVALDLPFRVLDPPELQAHLERAAHLILGG